MADERTHEDQDSAEYVSDTGDFDRDTDYITDRVTTDGAIGDDGLGRRGEDGVRRWPVEPGRYRLVAARACPWANRAVIVRRLVGLEDVISLGLPGPTHDERSWTFDLDPDGRDPVLGIERLEEAFLARDPQYAKGITVPTIVDVPSGKVVTNDFPQITLDLSTQWTAHHRDGAPDLYPQKWRDEIDEVEHRVYTEVNNGVYRCGFAGSQEAYEKAYDRLWTALDWLEDRLAGQRFLVGDTITEADVRLFTTLARFDAVYHGHFKCNRQKLSELPALWALRARPVPDPRVRRHHRLRPDQEALLRGAHRHQPHAGRAEGPGPDRLDHAPRAGVVGRQTLRRRHPAGPAARGRAGPGGAHAPALTSEPTSRGGLSPAGAGTRPRPAPPTPAGSRSTTRPPTTRPSRASRPAGAPGSTRSPA